jgi:uncharacterized protein YktB (UPF0637 family)
MSNEVFDNKDFELFNIQGLEERMEVLIHQLRPKFYMFGEELSSKLAEITEEHVYPHVAKHARRTTNPPNDSWVAFASNPRGYKMMPHFQICFWNTHLLIQWGIIYEAKNKQIFAENLEKNLKQIRKNLPEHFEWSKDHMKPEGTPMKEMSDEDILDFAKRLKHNKNGEIMVGLRVPRADALELTKDEFYKLVLETWDDLNYLHQLAK